MEKIHGEAILWEEMAVRRIHEEFKPQVNLSFQQGLDDSCTPQSCVKTFQAIILSPFENG